MLPHLVLGDFTVWDNDGLYALVMVVAVVVAIVLSITVMRKSQASDRRLHEPAALAAGQAEPTTLIAAEPEQE